MAGEEVTKQPDTSVFWVQVNSIGKLLTEHGIARSTVIIGIAIMIYALFNYETTAWQTSAIFVGGSVVIIGFGGLVRWAEMKYHLLSHRTVVLRCAKCKKPLHVDSVTGSHLEAPIVIQCKNKDCEATNFVQ